MQKFWKIKDSVETKGSNELILEGAISSESWFDDDVTPKAFRDELNKLSGDLTVIVNSPGGDVFAGLSIYESIRDYNGHVTAKVSGLAASIASIIIMGADRIEMSPGSLIMIHRPSTFAMGDTDDMDRAKELLLKIEDSIVSIYAKRTGLDEAVISDMMAKETWMDGKEATEKGFADLAIEAKSNVIQDVLSGKLAFSMQATEQSLKSFVEKVNMEEVKTPEIVETPEVVETPVVEAVEIKETTEPKQVDNKLNKEITMKTETEIAVDNIVKPVQSAEAVVVVDYLKTKKSIEDYARHLELNAGKTGTEVQDSWKSHLVTMGVTNPETLLPAALITEIQDAFAQGGEIFNLIDFTGLDAYNTAWDTVVGEDSRAKGYVRSGSGTTLAGVKAEEVITIGNRIMRPQFIYKYIKLNREDVKSQRSTGALVRYVLSELPKRIIREIERAAVIGDGRAAGDFKITSFISLAEDAVDATNPFATVYIPAALEDVYTSIVKAQALATAPGTKHLIAKQSFVTSLRLLTNSVGNYVFTPGIDIASALGFSSIITPDWLVDANSAVNDAFILTAGAYKGVGDKGIEAFQDFALSTNQNEYLQEVWAGGGLSMIDSAVAITAPIAS